MELRVWMLGIGAFLLAALLCLVVFRLVLRLRKPREAYCTVLKKQVCEYSQVTVGKYGLLNRSAQTVLFSIDGRTAGFYCPPDVYDKLQEGETGVLISRGEQVLSFQKSSSEM